MLHNQGVTVQKAREEITPKEIQKIIESIEGLPNEPMISRLAAAVHEAGKIYDRMQRTFWPGSQILLPFYIPDQKISGSADSQDH